MTSSLPNDPIVNGSDKEVKQFFDRYYTKQLTYPSNEVDAVISFFTKRGFDDSSAIAVSGVLLQQAKIDNIKIFKLLDTLKGLDEVQLSAIVAEVINYNRNKTSTVGYRLTDTVDKLERRNIKV